MLAKKYPYSSMHVDVDAFSSMENTALLTRTNNFALCCATELISNVRKNYEKIYYPACIIE